MRRIFVGLSRAHSTPSGHPAHQHPATCSTVIRPGIRGYSGSPDWLLTIENLTTFHQAAKALLPNRPGLVIYTAGMPSPTWGKAYANILMSLPDSTRILHWGDHDEGGFRVAARVAHFATTTGRHLEPWYMDASLWNERGDEAQAEQHRSMIRSAIRAGWAELASTLKAIILEQEGLPIRLP
ncbi:Wadjet anti-phage system protein JetD domain-containing protein [Pseudomonas sp. EL_65y_Pfl1_R32]|uniref:Wadjet anti-phage system protein JetD domain-containing protein n=1 Tax=Pseudomonas sp. EL_65y_Pfl1_R32 TaxID=3088696 RepID=UPI0030D7F771